MGTGTRPKTKLQIEAKVHPGDTDSYRKSSRGPQNTHRAWVYARCRARGSGQSKTQAVTHITPPCTLKVFYLADRQSDSNSSLMKKLLQIFLIT